MNEPREEQKPVEQNSASPPCYAAAAGKLLWKISQRVKAVRPDSLVWMYFRDVNEIVFDWSEVVTDGKYRWTHVFTAEVFEIVELKESIERDLWQAWTNQVQRKLFDA